MRRSQRVLLNERKSQFSNLSYTGGAVLRNGNVHPLSGRPVKVH